MKPSATMDSNKDLFREKLAQMINLGHPLCVMAEGIDWNAIDQSAFIFY